MGDRIDAGLWALCALLSIWIYVIITCNTAGAADAAPVSAGIKKPVMIIDPGHGGMDGGAVSVTGTHESDINWEIAERTGDLAAFVGVRAILTRDEADIAYPAEEKTISARKKWDTRNRVELINSVDNGVLVSIHQNFFPSAKPRGSQVIYGAGESSLRLALRMQTGLSRISEPGRDRLPVKAGKEIYIMTHVTCPSVLVECGFLSNPEEARRLETAEYQKKLSAVIVAVFYGFLGDEYT